MFDLAGLLLVNLAMLLSAEFWVYVDANEHGNDFSFTFFY